MKKTAAGCAGLLLSGLLLGACADSAATDSEADADADAEDESASGEPPAPGDSCEDTSLLIQAPTTLRASFQRATASELPGACGITGPTVFFRLRSEARVDLSVGVRGRESAPKLALLRPGCVSPELDPSRLLACADTLPVTLVDVGPRLELLLAVGLDQDDPALDLDPDFDPDAGELDPLEFELELSTRVVLAEGDRCDQPQTRCEAGTVCMDDSGDTGDEIPRCQRPPADSCSAPGLSVLALDATSALEIPPDEAHSDAHHHSCTGWRRSERVERLELPSELPDGAQLRVRVNDGRVGLALRGPDCAPEHALACAPAAGGDETFLHWGGEQLAALAAAGEAPLLFVELPNPETDLPLPAFNVSLELSSN